MSRSALTRHALHKSRQAVEMPLPGAQEEEYTRRVKQDELQVYGNASTYNLNNLLHQNILQSNYFRTLYNLKTYHEVIDEIYYKVDHAEPYAAGTSRVPSTCFCLLLKFCTMRLTVKQMNGLLKHTDSPYIRAVGFLYLRYTIDPEKLWEWFEPYLDDPEEFNASANPSDKTTIGAWLQVLLEEINYYGTILPRIPKKIQDSIKVHLLLHTRKKEREKENLAIVKYLTKGTKIRALYADEDNDPAMYDAVIDSVEENHEFWVTFPEYGNTEKVRLGDIEFDKKNIPRDSHRTRSRSRSVSASRSRSRSRGRRGRDRRHSSHRSRSRSRDRDRKRSNHRSSRRDRHSHSRSRSRSRRDRGRSRSRSANPPAKSKSSGAGLTDDLLAQVREQERRKAEASGKNYAARPVSYKGALSLKIDRYTMRKRSRSPQRREEVVQVTQPPPSSRTEELPEYEKKPKLSREALEKMQKLRAMYGDASAPKDDDHEDI